MLKYTILFFFSVSSFASTVLSVHETSGSAVRLERRFVKDCVVHSNGNMSITIQRGDGSNDSSSASLPQTTINHLRHLIITAEREFIEERTARCNGGSSEVTGYRSGRKVVIDDINDCQLSYRRTGGASAKIREISFKLCGF